MRSVQIVSAFFVLLLSGGWVTASPWNVREAGAQGDGVADDTGIFQSLLDKAGKAGGGVVDVPAGTYRITGNLSIPANVTLQGVFRSAVTSTAGGTILQAFAGRNHPEASAFITLAGHNAVVAGLAVVYPEWKITDVPPVPYPPCIANAPGQENTAVLDTLLLNPYEGIRLVRGARHLVRNVTGYPSWRGLHVDECYDIGRVENVHFWPFGVHYKHDDPFCQWVNINGTAFSFERTDWEYVSNTFCFGYGIGYHFGASEKGAANGNFSGIGADSCRRAVLVEQSQPMGLAITNGEFVGRWGSEDSVCVEIAAENQGKVSLTNCAFWGPIDRCIWMRSFQSQVTANACIFQNWDNTGQGSPAIQVDAGRAIVQGCTFGEDHLHVAVGKAVLSAILTANQAPGGFLFENAAGKRTQAGLNEAESIEWTEKAREHYRIRIGEEGDGRFLRGWFGPEHPRRWSHPVSRLRLPAVPGKSYTLTLIGHCPAVALDAESGLWLDDQRIIEFSPNQREIRVSLPAVQSDHYDLEIRCRGWVPQAHQKESQDKRLLGIQVETISMEAEGAETPIFDANTGEWLEK